MGHCLPCPTAAAGTAAYDSTMTARTPSPNKQGRTDAERELTRAESDYQRLQQAYLELARGEPNEVALAMVGADMERAGAALQSLSDLRQLPFPHQPSRVGPREARRLAEENA